MIADLVFFCEAQRSRFLSPFSAFALVVLTWPCDVHRNSLRFSHSYPEQEVPGLACPGEALVVASWHALCTRSQTYRAVPASH
jgi:hypothetical protein